MKYFWIFLVVIVLALIFILKFLLTKTEPESFVEADSIEQDLIKLSTELKEAQNLFDTIYSSTL